MADKFELNDKKIPVGIVAKCASGEPLKGKAIITISSECHKHKDFAGHSDYNSDFDNDWHNETENRSLDADESSSSDNYMGSEFALNKTVKYAAIRRLIDVDGRTDIEFDMTDELKIKSENNWYEYWDVKVRVELIESLTGFQATAEKCIKVLDPNSGMGSEESDYYYDRNGYSRRQTCVRIKQNSTK